MGIKKAAKKARKKAKKKANKAGNAVSSTASTVGDVVEHEVSKAWSDAESAGQRLYKNGASLSAQADAYAKEAEQALGKIDDLANALADAAFRQALERLAKQIFKDNRGMFEDAKKVAKGLQEAVELADDVNRLGNALKKGSISDEDASREANRLAYAAGLDELVP